MNTSFRPALVFIAAAVAGVVVACTDVPTDPIETHALRPLVFSSNIGLATTAPDIFVSKEDGSDAVNLTQDPSSDLSPAWSRDGKEIVFVSNRAGAFKDFDVYSTQSDGSAIRRLTTDAASSGGASFPLYESPRFSADGKKIVIVRRDGNEFPEPGLNRRMGDVYVMNADGSGATNLTHTPDIEELYPALSPDGKKLAFLRVEYEMKPAYPGGAIASFAISSRIYVANADGTGAQPLHPVDPEWGDDAPAWSPDGARIAFSAFDRHPPDFVQGWKIFVANANGTNIVMLTPGPGYYERFPAWSPDGTKIFYSISSDEFWGRFTTGLSVMNADGSDKHTLAWEPSKRALVGSPDAWTP